MPRDADFGRDLAAQLTAEFLGRIGAVNFTYNSYLELDKLSDTDPYCIISPGLYEYQREGRHDWREEVQLTLSLVSAVGATDSSQWIDDWLDSWDTLIRYAREIRVLGRHKPTQIRQDERYEPDMFHNNHRLFTQAVFTFANVEVT